MSNSARLLWFTLLLLGLSGCVESQSQSDVLKDSSCAAPCWNGLLPGLTDMESAQPILLEQGFNDEGTLTDIEGNKFAYLSNSDVFVEVAFSEAIVQHISFALRGNHVPTVADVVKLYGEPERVSLNFDDAPHSDEPCYEVYLLYPARGIFARVLCINPSLENELLGKGITLTPDAEIESVVYWASGETSYFELIEDAIASSEPWKGYSYYSTFRQKS